MARSGAVQSVGLANAGTTVFVEMNKIGNNFGGMTVTPAEATYTKTSAGLTTTERAGTRQTTYSFTVDETPNTTAASTAAQDVADAQGTLTTLLGQNGQRKVLRFRPQGTGTGLPTISADVVIQVSRTFAARGARSFSVECRQDGAATVGTQ